MMENTTGNSGDPDMSLVAEKKKIVIIGSEEESGDLLFRLKLSDRYGEVRHCPPDHDKIKNILTDTNIDIIVNASTDTAITKLLRTADQSKVRIMSSLCAELLLSSSLQIDIERDTEAYRSNILKCLSEMRRTVLLTRNKEELLKQILTHAMEALDADCGSIMLTDPRQRLLKIEMAHGIENDIVKSTVQKIGKGIAGRVARNCKPVIINGKATEDNFHELIDNEANSAISAPMTINNTVVGVLNISRKQSTQMFTNTDLDFAVQLADFAAGVIQTSKEFEISRLNALSHSLLSDTREILHLDYPLQERLNLLMMKLTNSLNGKICNLYQFDKESGTFLVQASSSFDLNKKRMNLIRLNDFFT
ncbi:MAG: GAF domain-containing protein, partial [Fibrobacter sp.]|nr:GAF domain-containing protein [Fibrobacter sp.]